MANYGNGPYGQPGPNQVPPPYNPYNTDQGYPGQAHPPNIGFNVHPPQQGMGSNENFPEAYGTVPDEENAVAKGFDFTDKSIRRSFIRKVFAILMLQLLITFGFVALVIYHKPTQKFIQRSPELMIAALVTLIVTMIALACCGNLRRKSPTNYILLFAFTLAESFFLGVIAAGFESEEVLMAIGVTAAVCLGLTLFALQTKWDFTAMGGILFVFLLIFLIVGICAIFIGNKVFKLIYASLGAMLFCVYLVFDIQIMMGGKHRYSISPEEYIFAALNLYLDVINIFIYILSIIGLARGN